MCCSLLISRIARALITLVHEQGTLLHEEYLEDGVRIVAKLPARIAPRLKRYRTE